MTDASDSLVLRKLPQKFISSEIDGELILIHGDSGAFFSLVDTGREIWQLLDGSAGIDTICDRLSAIYDVEASECRHEVEKFSRELVDAGFAEYV